MTPWRLYARVLSTALDLAVGIAVCRVVGHQAHWMPRDGEWQRRCSSCGKLTARA